MPVTVTFTTPTVPPATLICGPFAEVAVVGTSLWIVTGRTTSLLATYVPQTGAWMVSEPAGNHRYTGVHITAVTA